MPKRSAEDKIERYYKKIRRLENRKKSRVIYSDEESMDEISHENEGQIIADDPILGIQTDQIDESSSPQPTLPIVPIQQPLTPIITETIPGLATEPEPTAQAADAELQADPTLDPEIISALGASTTDSPTYGNKIHSSLVDLWSPLLKKGLTKDDKDKLLKEHLVPENCKLLQAPKLNAEISAAIADNVRGRDKKLQNFQQQLGSGTSAVNRAIDLLLRGDNKVQALKYLSDGCRILTDLHCLMTKDRIKLVVPSLDKTFTHILQDSERDETLFGNALSENIRASKAIERQGLQIKKTPAKAAPHSTVVRPAPASAPQGNWAGPSRYQYPSNRGGRGGPRRPAPGNMPRRYYQAPAPPQPRFATNPPRVRAPTQQ